MASTDLSLFCAKYWRDAEILSWNKDYRYLYLYILTSPNKNLCGIYRVSPTDIVGDTGLNPSAVTRGCSFLEAANKVRFSQHTGEVAIHNWLKWNTGTTATTRAIAKQYVKEVEDKSLIKHVAGAYKLLVEAGFHDFAKKIGVEETALFVQSGIYSLPSTLHFVLDEWSEWVDHRKQIGKPLTDLAKKKQVELLLRFMAKGLDLKHIINNSIASGYRTFYPTGNQRIITGKESKYEGETTLR